METINNICKVLRVLEGALDDNGAILPDIQLRCNFREVYIKNLLHIMNEGRVIECYWDMEKKDFVYRITLAGLEFMVKYE